MSHQGHPNMLQEILLSLSGVPSPIWEELKAQRDGGGLQNYVSQPEQSMLAGLSHLSQLHIEVKEHTSVISSKHASLVCRAVSSSINRKHLALFRKRIIEVESSILSKDASHVGAYQIVPLSTLVADFAPWERRLEWLQKITTLMKGSRSKTSSFSCTAADLMQFLEAESHTGFTDIGELATQLLIVAQVTWMRSITTWILYARLPSPGHEDFMIRQAEVDQYDQYVLQKSFIPKFVSAHAADCILAIGSALARIKSPPGTRRAEALQNMENDLLTKHLPKIKLLNYPLNPFMLESAMTEINASVSQHALSHLIPRSKVLGLCTALRDYMLLDKGEFAIALIENADARILGRQKTQQSTQPARKLGRVGDMALKEPELRAILSKTWSDLAAFQSQHEIEDEIFETAKQYLKLKAIEGPGQGMQSRPLTTFLPTPAMLQIEFSVDSPLQLFLASSGRRQYSEISAYLLSIRRSQLRVSGLWKLTSHRRCHPTPPGPPLSSTDYGRRACKLRRNREEVRAMSTRCFWSSMNKALFLLNEFSAYLHGEVIRNSWRQFEVWLGVASNISQQPKSLRLPKSLQHNISAAGGEQNTVSILVNDTQQSGSQDDPRALALGHSKYLTALCSALLLENYSFVQTLESFLLHLDHFIALFHRITVVWQGLDLQEDDGVMDAFTNYAQEEKDILSEMTRARDELENMLQEIVKNIRDIEKAHDTNNLADNFTGRSIKQDSAGDFVPWAARTLDRLIMKLDFLYAKDGLETNLEESEHE